MVKVLLAEDDQTMVGLLTTLLRMEGFEVKALDADGDIAAAVLRECPVLLVLDVYLAQQNGLDALQAIRRQDAAHQVRVIMTSGADVRDEARRRGADGFLLKPFMPDELIRLVREHAPAR